MSFEVPVVDISPWRQGAAGRREVAARIGRASAESGFFAIVGHGVPAQVIDTMQRTTRAFFALSPDEKNSVAIAGQGAGRGYVRLDASGKLAATLGQETPPDLRESYRAGPEARANDPYFLTAAASTYFMPNVWPATVPAMQKAWTSYYHALDQLSREVMAIFAAALDLPASWFESYIDRAISQLVALYYPVQATAPLPGQLRSGAHTDFGSITLLLAEDRPGGLQVMDGQGDWHDVKPPPGGFVVNLGDLMAQWTNGRWRSTLHRVVNPPAATTGPEGDRLSIAFFHQPNYDAVIECLPGCAPPGEAPKHKPLTSGAHLMEKLRVSKR